MALPKIPRHAFWDRVKLVEIKERPGACLTEDGVAGKPGRVTLLHTNLHSVILKIGSEE